MKTSVRNGQSNLLKIRPLSLAILSAGLLLSSCASVSESTQAAVQSEFNNLTVFNETEVVHRLYTPYVKAGVAALESGDYIRASKEFSHALKFDPTSADMHFLNALSYHLRAEAGDSSQFDMAKVGYELALSYDASNYQAAFQLGQINYSERAYPEAQDAFAYALLYDADNPKYLEALAVASYYAQDLETAVDAIDRAAQLDPENRHILATRILIESAIGNNEGARLMFADYRQSDSSGLGMRSNYVSQRIDDWQKFHQSNGILLAQNSTSDVLGNADAAITAPANSISPSSTSTSSTTTTSSTSTTTPQARSNRMVLVDVVIIRSEEINTTNKGLNLLGGLSSTLSGSLYNFSDTRTELSGAARTNREVRTISPSFSVSADYSLNIFTDAYDHNEVLARPTLIAEDGLKSEFFSGASFHVELGGAAGSLGAVQEVPVGIKLEVTPRFVDDNTIQMNVLAAREFIEGRSSQIGFNNFTQISKTQVNANVTMQFGDTLILSGLSERETDEQSSGVPLLKDLPGVQYMFSNENTLNYTKSVIIMMTPRRPQYTNEEGTAAAAAEGNLADLKKNNEYFNPGSNLDAVFHNLGEYRFFREFRASDVTMERWTSPRSIARMIGNSLKFIWY